MSESWQAPYAITFTLNNKSHRIDYESVLDCAEGFRDIIANPRVRCVMMLHDERPVFANAVRGDDY